MILGLVGIYLGYALAEIVEGFTGTKITTKASTGFTFIVSMIYTIARAYVGKKMLQKR